MLTVRHHVYLLLVLLITYNTTALQYSLLWLYCVHQPAQITRTSQSQCNTWLRQWPVTESVTEWVVCETLRLWEWDWEEKEEISQENKEDSKSNKAATSSWQKTLKLGRLAVSLAAVVLWVEGLMAVMRYLESKGTLALCLMNWWKWALQTWLPTLQYSYGQQGSHPEPSGRWQILNHQIPCLFFPLKPALQVAKQRGEHRRIWERILRQWYHAKLRSEIVY